MSGEQRFLQLLDMVATLTGQRMTADITTFYDQKLAPLGYDRVCQVLEGIAENPRRFPTVQDIKDALGEGSQSAAQRASELPHLIWQALETHHSIGGREEAIAKAVGPDGLCLIEKLGGWRHLLNITTNAAKTTLIAQWRDLAKAIQPELVRAATAPPEAPELPEGPRREVRQLIAAAADEHDVGDDWAKRQKTISQMQEMRKQLRADAAFIKGSRRH